MEVLFELAARLEASVRGPADQDLVGQLIVALGNLSRTLQDQGVSSKPPANASAAAAGFTPDRVPSAERSLRWPRPAGEVTSSGGCSSPVIAVVDQDPDFRSAVCTALAAEGLAVEAFANCDQFLRAQESSAPDCLIIDSNLPGMSGLKLLRTLGAQGHALPVIVVASRNEALTAANALKAGAVDFLEKPICREVLLTSVERALARGRESERLCCEHRAAAHRLIDLTPRQRQVMDLVLAGHPSKNIAADIGVSQRTVESHRAEVMRKTGVRSTPALARLAAAAAIGTAAPLSFDFGPTNGQIEAILGPPC